MFQYCLFDLDGTLTDPRIGITRSVQHALKYFGIEEPDLSKLEPFIGPPLKDSFMEFYGFTEKQALEAIEAYREYFAPKGVLENRIIEGIPQMLECLYKNGQKLAVASSKPVGFVHQILQHFEIEQYFDVIVGSELDGTRSTKEEVVREALFRLDILKLPDADRKDLCVMVGDRKFDIQGAKAFGLTGVGVKFGFAKEGELEEADADYIVETVEELSELIAGGKFSCGKGR